MAPGKVKVKAGGAKVRGSWVTAEELRAPRLRLTGDPAALEGHDVFIITVPTPVDRYNKPDLGAVIAASRTVG